MRLSAFCVLQGLPWGTIGSHRTDIMGLRAPLADANVPVTAFFPLAPTEARYRGWQGGKIG
jgi:hypothetical protein